jgi:Winged helix DNA-binding domain
MKTLKTSWARAAAWRADRHHLGERAPEGSMLSMVSRLCGVHAQVLSSAELSLWARVDNLQRGAVQRALWEQRTLIKTWAMRGTLHLLPASELPQWHGALATSKRYRTAAGWKRLLGITLDELDRLTDTIGKALHGRVLTREQLVREVGRISRSKALAGKIALNSWGTVFKPAAFAGHLCFGPSVGQRVQFTHPATWIGAHTTQVAPDDATLALTRRYLAAYGPATDRDLHRWWGGASLATVRKWIAGLGDEAAMVEVDGTPAWMLAEDARELRDAGRQRSVRLLPAFDHYVIAASRHAHHLLPGDLRGRVYRPQGWVSAVLLVNGVMEGTWKHEAKGGRVEVEIDRFRPQPRWVERAAAEEAERLAQFFS